MNVYDWCVANQPLELPLVCQDKRKIVAMSPYMPPASVGESTYWVSGKPDLHRIGPVGDDVALGAVDRMGLPQSLGTHVAVLLGSGDCKTTGRTEFEVAIMTESSRNEVKGLSGPGPAGVWDDGENRRGVFGNHAVCLDTGAHFAFAFDRPLVAGGHVQGEFFVGPFGEPVSGPYNDAIVNLRTGEYKLYDGVANVGLVSRHHFGLFDREARRISVVSFSGEKVGIVKYDDLHGPILVCGDVVVGARSKKVIDLAAGCNIVSQIADVEELRCVTGSQVWAEHAGNLVCYDLHTGELLWSQKLKGKTVAWVPCEGAMVRFLGRSIEYWESDLLVS